MLFFRLIISIFLTTLPAGALANSDRVLFFNPLVRENATASKLQGLRFVSVDGFAPFSAFDGNGKLRGIHVDLARAICAELKVETNCTLQAVAYDEVTNLLISGQAEVALAGLVPSSENRKELDFSVPYFRYPSKFLVRTESADSAILEFGVIAGSIHQTMAEQLFPTLKRVSYANETEAIAALKAGNVPALFGDGLGLALAQSAEPALNCCRLKAENYYLPALRSDTLSAAISNKRTDVLAAINTVIRQLASDGRLEEIYLRNLPVSPLQ
ncbi:MAG: transporter substrate-binding domain-containing protein [Notoacmeibacter sp.]